MALPPKKPAGGRPTTGRASARSAPPTRRGAGPAASAAKNPMPLYLGIGGGVLVLAIIIIVVASSGGEEKPGKVSKKEAKPEAAKKAPPPDVSSLEATGKSKCEEGQRLIQPRLNPDPQAPRDRVYNDLENGLKLINEGL